MFFHKNLFRDSFFDDINGKCLDFYQRKIVLDNSQNLLVVAAAGSGKSLTIVAKIRYLIEKKGFNPGDILCLSFTNETVDSLKNKMTYPVNIMTFHKLALKIIHDNDMSFNISSDSLLNYLIEEFFHGILPFSEMKNLFMEYFHSQDNYDVLLKTKNYTILKYNVLSLIKKLKCNNLKVKDLYQLRKKCFYYKDKILLYFVLRIYLLYEEELQSEGKIDFDDMIMIANRIIEKDGFISNYKYIIIDEYQDISLMRFSLIKTIMTRTNAKLMCVGDDYQAIYGFAGSRISFFLDFLRFFPHAKRLDIRNTYRNSYELIKGTKHFICKNKYQLRKKINATFLLRKPIVLVYYDDLNQAYNNLINYLYLEKKKNIMVLARYNEDFKLIKNVKEDVMDIRYLTVHRAKGLECDNTIILKVSDDYLGFPSKIMDNHLSLLMDNFDEEISFAEERRLFYVALTRCKERVYLLVPRKNPSIFIDEIKRYSVELFFK